VLYKLAIASVKASVGYSLVAEWMGFDDFIGDIDFCVS
jgi:hypothetical protein